MQKQDSELMVAPRAGFEPATNRLTAKLVLVSRCFNRFYLASIFAAIACLQ
jgi:hypothetical protein